LCGDFERYEVGKLVIRTDIFERLHEMVDVL
jgi:hypothetical protein